MESKVILDFYTLYLLWWIRIESYSSHSSGRGIWISVCALWVLSGLMEEYKRAYRASLTSRRGIWISVWALWVLIGRMMGVYKRVVNRVFLGMDIWVNYNQGCKIYTGRVFWVYIDPSTLFCYGWINVRISEKSRARLCHFFLQFWRPLLSRSIWK